MAIAGRVAIVPKGEWSQSVTYDKLDLVTHNGNTFIAYKSSVGVTPVDGDTWMLILEGVDPQDIDNIINGTTPVGNANKLGGKSPSELSVANADTVDGWHIYSNPNELGFTGAFTMAELCSKMADKTQLYWVNTLNSSGSAYASDVPGTYGMLTAVKRGTWCYATWIEINKKTKVPLYAGSWHSDNGWTGWGSPQDFCLPLTGGKVNGVIENVGGIYVIKTVNGVNNKALVGVSDDGRAGLYHTTDKGNDASVRFSPTRFSYQGANGEYDVLHTGNSQKVASGTTAPSDTTSLWYDTTNKILKRYVDGAWQA